MKKYILSTLLVVSFASTSFANFDNSTSTKLETSYARLVDRHSPAHLVPASARAPKFDPIKWVNEPHRWLYKPAVAFGIDWRASYFANTIVDGIQTYQFPFKGIQEVNYFVAPFVTRQRINTWFPIMSIVYVSSIDSFIQNLPKEDRTFWYAFAWTIHALTIKNNAGLGVKGVPILIPAILTKSTSISVGPSQLLVSTRF